MLRRIKKFWTRRSSEGQNLIEYVLVFAGVVTALVVALGPSGFVTQKIEETMNLAMIGTKCVVLQTCFDPAGCPTVCGNDCCEPGESVNDCPEDCSLCMSDAQCDDGVACNGTETCDPATGCQPGGLVCGNCIGPDGAIIAHGGSRTYFQDATPPFGGSCVSESRMCYDGTLSGSFTEPACAVSAPADCGAIPHGGSARFYQSATVACGEPCVWEMRVCNDGVLSGSYGAAACAESCDGCPPPEGGPDIPNGGNRMYYQAVQEECWTLCSQEVRNCVDGFLSGSFTATSCFISGCNDGVPCTDDTCEVDRMIDWGCVFTPNDSLCDDGITCTGTDSPGTLPLPRNSPAGFGDDYCNAGSGCQFDPHNSWCADGVACTFDICNVVTDCQNPPNHPFCNDGVMCTDDSCDVIADCQNNPNDAHCVVVGECAIGTCDVLADCQYTPTDINCDDGVVCTNDWCDPALVCHRDPVDADCDDGVACTVDTCHVALDCQNAPDNAFCTDNDVCTGIDSCHVLLGCQSTPALDCDDLDVCTGIDSCHALLGCQSTPALDCDNADVCDGPESCDALLGCQPGVALDCDDLDPCTADSCDAMSGCQNVNVPIDGAWGGAWVNVDACGASTICQQLQQQQTCIGASCGGVCSGPYPEQYIDCDSANCPQCEHCSGGMCVCDICGVVCCVIGPYGACI